MKVEKVFVAEGEHIIYSAPSFTHDLILLAAGIDARVFKVVRYDYDAIMHIEDIWNMGKKVGPYRIMGMKGGYIWQDYATLQKAIGEFCTRTNPYVPVSQRSAYLELVQEYGKDDILIALKGIYGSLC